MKGRTPGTKLKYIQKKRYTLKNQITAISVFLVVFGVLISCQTATDPLEWTDEQAMIKALEWQEANPIFARGPMDWTNGAYYTGVYKAHKATHKDVFLDALVEMGIRNEWKPWERFYHADDLTICSSYLYLKSLGIEGVDLQPTDTIIQQHLYKPHEWKEGNKDKNQQILWWWCDALFMTPPVLTAYAKLKDDPSYLDIMHTYYMETYNLLFDEEEKLFARDLHYVWKGDSTDVKESNGKKVFWSRGNGWVTGGLALVLDQMPADYEHRPFYENLYRTLTARLLEIQPEDGLWRTSLLCPEAYDHGEVSGSGFYTFALAWGINNGMLDRETYEPAVRKAWEGLRGCQKADGMVGWVQNIGAEPKPASHDSWQNYGTGAFLLAGSEILKLDESKETAFKALSTTSDWDMQFEDKCTEDWTQKWTLDGLIAQVKNSDRGMHFSAGPEYKNDAHHAVMWTKESFDGDVKIEYDYTRTDSETSCVNILYIQATGDMEGPYVKDISDWKELREVPAMSTYFENMNALHISYAAFVNSADTAFYIRARRYPKPENESFNVTRITPSYDNEGYFKTGEKYHITVIKTGAQLFFKMEGKEGEEIFSWDLSNVDPVTEGRIGLRHMYTRSAVYRNMKIYTK